ncbi:MAG TPA: hypothetical protein PLN31_14540 [Azoarcus taiwanensis]|nr:hypothetical protein [Azoarcus taiwanensis]
MFKALWNSFIGKDIGYYPRQCNQSVSSDDVIKRVTAGLNDFEIGTADTKTLMDRVKDSLEEGKKQTEYQDTKAARLLTIVAFLTAAVAAVFSKFIDKYPLHDSSLVDWQWYGVIVASYAFFGLYILSVAAGAMMSFHAMRTRFFWPGGKDTADGDKVRSLLFFQPIVGTTPEAWAEAFAVDKDKLLREYYKNYVTEAYLVAAKAADKIRYLDPAQRLLHWGIRFLLLCFLSVILTFAFVPPADGNNRGTQASPGIKRVPPDSATPSPVSAVQSPAIPPSNAVSEKQTVPASVGNNEDTQASQGIKPGSSAPTTVPADGGVAPSANGPTEAESGKPTASGR